MKGDIMRTPHRLFLLLAVGLPATFLSSPAKAAALSRPHVFFGEVKADTVMATPEDVFPQAIKAFEDDGWVAKRDTLHGMVVTDWREFHHPLAKLLYGKLMARCEVEIRALDDQRTILLFRGGIASPSDIESNPAFGLAKAAYYEAVHGYYRDLHTGLADEHKGKNPTSQTLSERLH
jgi:hypothetical protein